MQLVRSHKFHQQLQLKMKDKAQFAGAILLFLAVIAFGIYLIYIGHKENHKMQTEGGAEPNPKYQLTIMGPMLFGSLILAGAFYVLIRVIAGVRS